MSALLSEDRGPVRILAMNRPEKRNALNTALGRMHKAMLKLKELMAD